MGNYVTTEILEERITAARLTNLCRGLTGASRTTMLTNVIERAEAMIDGYLANIYTVPVTANALCEEWALVCAEYELYKRGTSGDVPEKIKMSYTDTINQLKDVAKGLLSLPTTATLKTENGSSMDIDSDDPRYDQDNMNGY